MLRLKERGVKFHGARVPYRVQWGEKNVSSCFFSFFFWLLPHIHCVPMQDLYSFSACFKFCFHVDNMSLLHAEFLPCGLAAVKQGLLHKDCVDHNGDCLAVVVVYSASLCFRSRGSKALPALLEFMGMKPCLFKFWACAHKYFNYDKFFLVCKSIDYLWTDARALEQCCMAMTRFHHLWKWTDHWMDIQSRWSPCRAAWMSVVMQ